MWFPVDSSTCWRQCKKQCFDNLNYQAPILCEEDFDLLLPTITTTTTNVITTLADTTTTTPIVPNTTKTTIPATTTQKISTNLAENDFLIYGLIVVITILFLFLIVLTYAYFFRNRQSRNRQRQRVQRVQKPIEFSLQPLIRHIPLERETIQQYSPVYHQNPVEQKYERTHPKNTVETYQTNHPYTQVTPILSAQNLQVDKRIQMHRPESIYCKN
jgi:hypothetical protein